MKRYLLTIVWFFVGCLIAVAPVPAQAAKDFKAGWWCRITDAGSMATWANQGQTVVLAYEAQSASEATVTNFLNTAQANGIKVILGLSPVWNISTSQCANIVNTHKSHPALLAWYLADEPELNTSMDIHGLLDGGSGYYQTIKANDPGHPVLISFNYPYDDSTWDRCRTYYDTLDILGVHSYTKYASDGGEWVTGEARKTYDMWRQMVEDAEEYGKDTMATCQGFSGGGAFGIPTYAEIRHSVFSAVVQGVDKVLFWMWQPFGANNPADVQNVQRMVAEMQSVGAEMNNGETFSPDIQVSESAERLAYRYGVNGESHAIVAVNIADRAAGGSPITAQFSLPAGVDVDSVEVLHENRSIQVSNGSFTDDFVPFGVHIYRFSATGTSPAPAPAPSAPAPAPEEPAPAPEEPAPAPAPAPEEPAPAKAEPAPAPTEPDPALSPESSSPFSKLLNLIGVRKGKASTSTGSRQDSNDAVKSKAKPQPNILFQLLRLS